MGQEKRPVRQGNRKKTQMGSKACTHAYGALNPVRFLRLPWPIRPAPHKKTTGSVLSVVLTYLKENVVSD